MKSLTLTIQKLWPKLEYFVDKEKPTDWTKTIFPVIYQYMGTKVFWQLPAFDILVDSICVYLSSPSCPCR